MTLSEKISSKVMGQISDHIREQVYNQACALGVDPIRVQVRFPNVLRVANSVNNQLSEQIRAGLWFEVEEQVIVNVLYHVQDQSLEVLNA